MYFCSKDEKGRAVVFALPRKAVAFLTLCSVLKHKVFRSLRRATRGSAPSTPPPLKRWTKLLDYGELCWRNNSKQNIIAAGLPRPLRRRTKLLNYGELCWRNNSKQNIIAAGLPRPLRRRTKLLNLGELCWRNNSKQNIIAAGLPRPLRRLERNF